MFSITVVGAPGGLYGYDDYYYGEPVGSGPSGFALFASCWTVLFIFYLFLTSTTGYIRTEKPIGRFYNQRIAFAVDCLSAVFWFAGFISLAQYEDDESVYGVVVAGIFLAFCLWYEQHSTLTLEMSTDVMLVLPSS